MVKLSLRRAKLARGKTVVAAGVRVRLLPAASARMSPAAEFLILNAATRIAEARTIWFGANLRKFGPIATADSVG